MLTPVIFVEQMAGQMARSPDPSRSKAERVCLGVRNQFRDGLYRNRRIDLDDIGHTHYAGDRCRVADEIEAEMLVEGGIAGDRRRDHEKRVAISRGLDDGFGADIAPGARPVFDNELLA
jgi:hypothetical protein